MGRHAKYAEADILEGARSVSAESGPQRLTIAAVAAHARVPVGSIYHRYASRDEILAALWLELVEAFQTDFLAALDGRDAVQAGLAAVRHVCRWIRTHPREARLLLLHRREDFASGEWPASHRRRAERLAAHAAASLGAYAERLAGDARALRQVRFALVDLPTAALKRDVEEGEAPTEEAEAMLLATCAHVLRRAARRQPTRRTRR